MLLTPDLQLPEKLSGLFEPRRYKIMHGGRGGAKSWGVARALLMMGASKKMLILCAREYQASIEDSVHKLLSEQIHEIGLGQFYEVQKTRIVGRNGTEFIFRGLRNNISSVRSTEGIDVAWVEEADTVSNASWEVLIPTVRKDGSEIWVTFNPKMKEDATYKRFVAKPPKDSWVQKVNWSDNPWFPETLRREKDELKETDPDKYLNIWEGHCVEILDGAIYASEIRAATEKGRIGVVPHQPNIPVHTFWDLGWADQTSIWFAQSIGFEYHFIDYIAGPRKTIEQWIRALQEKPYIYGTDYLPHDAAKGSQVGDTPIKILRTAGRTVQLIPSGPGALATGINAARTIFPLCRFDEEHCSDGLQALRHYRYEFDDDLKTYKKTPLHDWSSHGADAFRYAAMSLRVPEQKPSEDSMHNPLTYGGASTAWMS